MKALRTYLPIIAALVGISLQTVHAGYDPTKGRFISREPIGENGGENLYRFVNNFPVSEIDVLGKSVFLHDQHDARGLKTDKLGFTNLKTTHDLMRKFALMRLMFPIQECPNECDSCFIEDPLSGESTFLGYGKLGKQEMRRRIFDDVMEYHAATNLWWDIESIGRSVAQHRYSYDTTVYNLHGDGNGETHYPEPAHTGPYFSGGGTWSIADVKKELVKIKPLIGKFGYQWCGSNERRIWTTREFNYEIGNLKIGEQISGPSTAPRDPNPKFTIIYKPSAVSVDK
jgi:hypothetical protein